MPKRKPSSPIESSFEKLVNKKHKGNALAALDDALEAIWSHSPEAERVFERAAGVLDDEELLREVAALLLQVSRRLGHTDMSFTAKLYGHLKAEHTVQAAESFNRLASV